MICIQKTGKEEFLLYDDKRIDKETVEELINEDIYGWSEKVIICSKREAAELSKKLQFLL